MAKKLLMIATILIGSFMFYVLNNAIWNFCYQIAATKHGWI